MPASTYEHYFLSDTSKVVSHKPVNLLVQCICQGQKHTFSLAIKTSEDKIKRRLNKTVPLKEIFLCDDSDVAYQERRQAQEAAAAAAALMGGGGDDDDPPPPILPVPTTKAQIAARQEQLNYIGSKELFTSYPGGGIVCLRLRPAEEQTPSKKRAAAAASQAAANGDAPALGPTPLPPDVAEASSDGFLFSVETKGGKSAGRQKQRYVLLKRSCIYTLLLPSDIKITRIETRDKHGETVAIKHWISTHAQLVLDTNQAVTKWAEQTPASAPFAATMFAQPAAFMNGMTHSQQQGAAAAAAIFMGTMAALSSQGLSPFSSQGVSPAHDGRPRNGSNGSGNAFISSSTPHSHSSGAGSNQISPANNPYLFAAAAAANFNHRSPPGQSSHLMHAYGINGHMGMMASSNSSAAAAFANTLAAMTSSPGTAVNFPSPSNQLMANLGMMLPHSNNVSPSGMGIGLGLGMGQMGLPFQQQQQFGSFNPMLSNPGSNRSNAALSNFSAQSSAVMSPAMSPANQQQQQQQSLQPGQQQSASFMPNGMLLGTQQLSHPQLESPLKTELKPASQFGDHGALQQQIEQLQALLHQQRVQQQQQQQQQAMNAMMQQQQQQLQHSLAQHHRPTAGGPRQGSGKFDFSIPTAATVAVPAQIQPAFYAHQQQPQQAQHVPMMQSQYQPAIGSIPPLSSTSSATTRSAGTSHHGVDASSALSAQHRMYNSGHPAIKEEDDTVSNVFSSDSPQFVGRGNTGGTAAPSGAGMESMMDSHHNASSQQMQLQLQPQHSTLNSAYWNPPNPHAPTLAHASGSSLELPSVNSPDFLCADLFTEPAQLHAGLEVPSSFFASPLVDSGDSSNSSHSSRSQGHSPIVDGHRAMQQPQLPTSPLPSAAAAMPSASNLATALRAPAFPLLGGSQQQLLVAAPLNHSSNSSTSGGSGDQRRNKRKKQASTKKRRAGSASSSVVSESAHAMRRGTGYSLSPRQWKLALKKPPFRATLSVTRSNHAGRFKPDDVIQVRFGGVFLDPSKIDCYKRHALIDIPPPPSTAALMASNGLAGVSPPLSRTTIEVDLELHVNGQLKFATAFSYKLGPTPSAVAAGDATTSSSSDPDDSDDSDDADDRSGSGSDLEDDSFGGGGGGGAGGAGRSPDSAPDGSGSPDRPDRSSGDSKRRRGGEGGGNNNSSNPGGSSNYTTQHSTSGPAVRLVADFESIPLFSRGVLKSFPLLSQGLQDLLQNYLLSTSGARSAEMCEEDSADASVIMEEADDGSSAAAAPGASAVDSSPLRKRFSTGSRVFEKLQQSALNKVAAEARAAGAAGAGAGFSPPRSSQTVPNTPVKSAFRRPNAANGNAIAAAKQLSAAARATARVLFLQAISSQQPLQFVNAALSATMQAALQPTAPPAWCAHQGINGTDSYGFTLLHYAVAAGLVPLAEKLLMMGANPHLQARTAHASHAFSPAQLLQLRQVSTEERAARRVARAAKRATKALTQGSPASSSPTLSSSAVSSPHPKPIKLSRSHDKKKRRTSVEDADESGSVGSVPSGSVGSEEHELSSETSESVMADAADAPASPLQTAHQPLFAGFSSLHSLAPSPYGSAASSASNSLTSTPTNAAALKAARTPVTGRDILSASQKSFHFGVPEQMRTIQPTNATLSSGMMTAEKLLQANNFHMQQQHQHQPLHIYHVHQPLQQMQMQPVPQDKMTALQGHSTATTAAPTPSSHTHSVMSSPHGMWRLSPASAAMSPQTSQHVSLQSVSVPAPLTPMDAVETNKALASIFHAHSVSPQGLSLAAAAAQAHFTHSATASVHSPSNAGASSMPHHFALTANPALESFVSHRLQMAQQRVQAKKYLAHLQAQLRQSQSIPQPSPPSPSFAQSEEDREQQRELVMLELAMLILYAQKAMTALNLSLPASSAPALEADALTSPMQSLHIHTLRSLLGQFQILRRYFLAYRKYQEAQNEVGKLAEGICIDEGAAASSSAPAAGASPASSPRKSPRKSTGSRFESLAASSASSIAAAAASSSLQSPASFASFSDDSIFGLFVHVAAVECALRDQVVHMQRVLAPFMQRALLQTKIMNEKTRAQNQVRARAAAVAASAQAGNDVHMVQSGLTSLSMSSPLRQRGGMPSTPLSQGHLSRTHSGQLSLNIVGSLHPDREDDELAIRIREVHAVDVLQGRRIDLVVNPSLEAQESAAEAARDSARKQAAHSRLQSPEQKSLIFSASLEEGTRHLAPPPLLAPHPSPSNAAATPKLTASEARAEFQYRPRASSAAAAAAPSASAPGHKYALLIGINHYSPELAVSPLLGCENDCMRIGGILQAQYGFDIPMAHASSEEAIVFGPQSRSHMLLHQCATRQAVRRALQSLAAAAQSPADSVIVYFAGHGFHACVLLYDGVLDYSEFAQLLSDIATKDCTFVSDTCATERVPRALMNTVSARKTTAAVGTAHNTSLTLEQMRALVGTPSPDAAADRMHAAQAAAEILAALTPESVRPRHLATTDAAADADADGEDDDESDVGESGMEDVPAPSAASSSRRSGGGAGVQYRGLAFNKIEPREPTSEALTVPTRRSTRRSVSDDVDADPSSAGPCNLSDSGDHALKAASQRVIPVIQRLLSRRGYLARGLLSQSDKRASEVQSSSGSYHGAFTARLCDKLESAASPSTLCEPANPCMVSLRQILFHDEDGGNLSASGSTSSGSSSRSNSLSGSEESLLPLLAASHLADEIDPSSACAEMDLGSMLLDATADDEAFVGGASVASEHESSDDSSSSDDDEDDTQGAAACAAAVAAFDASCSQEDQTSEAEPAALMLTSEDEAATPTEDDEPATVGEEFDEQPLPIILPVLPAAAPASSSMLFVFLLALYSWILAPIRAVTRAFAPAADVPVAASAPSSPLVVFAPPSPKSRMSADSLPSTPRPVSADLLTTEAASDSSSSGSGGSKGRRFAVHGSDSESSAPAFDLRVLHSPDALKRTLPSASHRSAPVGFSSHW